MCSKYFIYTICCLLFACLLLTSQHIIASEISWDWEEWDVITKGTICEGKVGITRDSYEKRSSIEDKQLVDMLSDRCYLKQWVSIQTIGERKDISKLSVLYKILLSTGKDNEKYIDSARNALILWAIAKIGHKDSVKVVISFLDNEESKNNKQMVEKALYTLGFFETEESIKFLIEYANSKENFLFGRFIALEMLGSMQNSIAQNFINNAQSSESGDVRKFCRKLAQTKKEGVKWEKDMTELILDSF
jgi:HEAT repeat protein